MNTRTTQLKGDPLPIFGGYQTALAAFRGHRFVEGEGGAAPATPGEGASPVNGAPAGTGAAPANPPANPAPPAAPSPATVAAQQQQQNQPETFSRDYVHELREEAKTNRIAHQEAQKAREEAEKQLAEAQAQLTQYQRDNAIRAAAKDIANADLLLDSSSFQQTLAEVNLADPEAVKAAITGFVEKNSAYGPTPTLPGSSGGTPTGGTTETPKTLEGATAAHYSK